jgi:hypothetical protein
MLKRLKEGNMGLVLCHRFDSFADRQQMDL